VPLLRGEELVRGERAVDDAEVADPAVEDLVDGAGVFVAAEAPTGSCGSVFQPCLPAWPAEPRREITDIQPLLPASQSRGNFTNASTV
jgi:hypothetical protein